MTLDIILLALISYFIIKKLLSQFGKFDETDKDRKDIINIFKQGRCGSCKTSKQEKDEVINSIVSVIKDEAKEVKARRQSTKTPLDKQLDEIFAKITDMDKEKFLQGAEDCFEMVISSFTKKFPEVFGKLVSKAISDGMKKEISKLDKKKKNYNVTIVAIPKKEIISAKIVNKNAFIEVLFTSKQIMYKEDFNSKLIEGDKEKIQTISEIWTFKKDLGNEDPNWIVIETKSPKLKK
ncbi:Tim44 domain-containing protein [Pseudomonadota bacterium]